MLLRVWSNAVNLRNIAATTMVLADSFGTLSSQTGLSRITIPCLQGWWDVETVSHGYRNSIARNAANMTGYVQIKIKKMNRSTRAFRRKVYSKDNRIESQSVLLQKVVLHVARHRTHYLEDICTMHIHSYIAFINVYNALRTYVCWKVC